MIETPTPIDRAISFFMQSLQCEQADFSVKLKQVYILYIISIVQRISLWGGSRKRKTCPIDTEQIDCFLLAV